MNGMSALAQDPYLVAPFRPMTVIRGRTTPLVWLMSLYVFFLPIEFSGATINFAPSDVFLALAVFFCFFRLRIVSGTWSFLHLALIACFLWSAGTSLWLHGSLSNYVIVKVGGLLILFVSYLCLTTAADSWREIRRLMRAFIFAVTLNCLVSVVALKVGISYPWLNYNNQRLSGMFLDPNAFGGLVLVALLMQVGSYVGGRVIVSGILGGASSFIMAAALFLTLSRSAWIGFSLGFILISIIRPRVWLIATVLTAMLVAGAYIVIRSQASAKDDQLFDRSNTAMERVEQIQRAIPMFESHPILGIGLGEYVVAQSDLPFPTLIHNTTAWILTEMGLVGFTCYVAFVLWFFRRGWIALRVAAPDAKPLIVGLLGAHLGMLGLSTGIEVLYQRHWWMVMALLASSAVVASRDLAFRLGQNDEI